MQLNKINEVLSEDYYCRRQMMLKRFQVTLESFAWGDKQEVGAPYLFFMMVDFYLDFYLQQVYVMKNTIIF